MVETVALSSATKTYTIAQVEKMLDDVYMDKRGRIVRELAQGPDARTEQNLLAQLRTLEETRGMINVRIER